MTDPFPELSAVRQSLGPAGGVPWRPAVGRLDHIASPVEPFLDVRAAIITARVGDGGTDTCEALTAGLDEALQALGAALPADAAVIALGGYGRREQCIWSDVDVMVLHADADPESLARSVFYPLWDAGLKVGHAIRTVPESHEAGSADLETLTSLLSARLISGDGGLY
ncbi:MAG: hypothetical protein HKN80_04790, partial [Acidimicrobiia bacterium]|nr:hypothetical protein [Acidimicrobiia bacterium]